MATTFIPSKYQVAVYDHVTNGTGNAVINAKAGSGKTSTIISLLNLIPATFKILFLAFNKAIAMELANKIDQSDLPNKANIEAKTLHQHGFHSFKNTHKFVTVDADKYKKFIKSAIQNGAFRPDVKLEYDENLQYISNLNDLANFARIYLAKTTADLDDICEKHDVICVANEYDYIFEILEWGKSNTQIIDFTDQIWLNLVLPRSIVNQYDFILIDECQDLNTIQRELLLKTLKPTSRFIAVGDPAQAIYGFSGADVESFNVLKNIPNTVELPLSVCYRCDSDIINLAKRLVPEIEAREGADKGSINYEASVSDMHDGDMVLCRITAPLVTLCLHLISKGIKATIKGKDIAKNLTNMIEKYINKIYIADVIEKLEKDYDKAVQKFIKKNNCTYAEAEENGTISAMRDKINVIMVIAENTKKTADVINRINTIFNDTETKGIVLSTVHKAKGLEADRVFIIRPDKFYLKRAMKKAWTAQQEANLEYVALTRPKHFLGYIQPKCDTKDSISFE